MLAWIGSRQMCDLGRVALILLVTACATTGEAVPPVAVPEPVAVTRPEPARPRPRAVKPAAPQAALAEPHASLPAAVPPVRAAAPRRAAQSPRVQPRSPAKIKVDSAALERAITKRFAYEPLSKALARRTRKTELADRIAAAVVYEAERNRISPSLLAAVLIIENAPFDTTAISSQGAVGLMQVMPVHIGSYGCPSKELHSVEANICHGARVLQNYLKRSKTIPLALKRYNGCVRSRNTPRCWTYPNKVLRVASKLRHEMLVHAAGFEGGLPDEVSLDELGPAEAIPSQPVLVADTSVTMTTTSASECTTFVGCLKNRWSSR